jgi:hypothetical protein
MAICTITVLFNYKHITELVCDYNNVFTITQILDKSEDVFQYKWNYNNIDYTNNLLNYVGIECKKLVAKFDL